MWVFIWILITVFIAGVVVWNQRILLERKSTWKKFANKYRLQYTAGKLMQSPSISGKLSGLHINLYEDVQKTDDLRGERFVTVMNVDLGEGMPTGAAIATKEFTEFINSLRFNDTYTPNETFKDQQYIVRTRDAMKLRSFLTEERLKYLHAIFSMKNSITLLFFDELEAILHIETTDPLKEYEHLEKVIKKVMSVAKKLLPEDAEKTVLTDEQREEMLARSQPAQTEAPAEASQESNAENKTATDTPADTQTESPAEEIAAQKEKTSVTATDTAETQDMQETPASQPEAEETAGVKPAAEPSGNETAAPEPLSADEQKPQS